MIKKIRIQMLLFRPWLLELKHYVSKQKIISIKILDYDEPNEGD